MVYIEKTFPSPTCLEKEKTKANGDYKCGETLNRIKQDFKNKCYICEYKEPVTINVEHFKPHKGDKDLKFEWENLFLACSHCNNIKRDKYNHLINCTDPNENIEERIRISIKVFPMEKVKIEALDNSIQTMDTVSLLDAVYNGTTKLKKIEANNLRTKIQKDLSDFNRHLYDYFDESLEDDDRDYTLKRIIRHLKKASSFTMFKRIIVKENDFLREKFEQYFD